MDGNNRWSKKKSISKFTAYKKGANNLIKLSDFIFNNSKTNFISAFALSKNNLDRPSSTLNIIKKVLKISLKELDNKKLNFDIHFFGNFNFIDKKSKDLINQLNKINNYSKKLYIYINYGGREDIEKAAINTKSKNNIFKNNLITYSLPDPDILIRTGGFHRLSNFLLYEIAFTELFFLNKLWPDLNISDLRKIFEKYSIIERKFGR